MSQRNPDVVTNLEPKAEVDGDSQPIFDGDSQPIFESDSQPILDGDPISIFVDDDGDAQPSFGDVIGCQPIMINDTQDEIGNVGAKESDKGNDIDKCYFKHKHLEKWNNARASRWQKECERLREEAVDNIVGAKLIEEALETGGAAGSGGSAAAAPTKRDIEVAYWHQRCGSVPPGGASPLEVERALSMGLSFPPPPSLGGGHCGRPSGALGASGSRDPDGRAAPGGIPQTPRNFQIGSKTYTKTVFFQTVVKKDSRANPYPQGFPCEYIAGVGKALTEMIEGHKEIEGGNSFVSIETKVTITVD